jgi:RNA polymerase sigma-70 factor (ECF subfamily)
MTVDEPLAIFAALRPRLFGIAYRMLGSAAEAEDVVQDAWVRWSGAAQREIEDPTGFLVTMVARQALDVLGSARVRRAAYVGPWLPEPISTAPTTDPHALSLAFLHLLERLTPAERAAYLLVEVFDYRHAEVAAMLGKTEAGCRQLVARARKAVRAGRPRPVAPDAHQRILVGFLSACASGDVAGLARMLADDVACLSDGGGRVTAARRVVTGPDRVARMMIGLARKQAGTAPRLVWLNGEPALVLAAAERIEAVVTVAVVEARIATICLVRNPDKLRGLAAPRVVG